MPGLDRHLRTIDAEEHSRLAFRRDCPHCRPRLAGPPPSGDVVPVRAKAALATAAVLASGALPAVSAAAEQGGDQVAEIEPPPGPPPTDPNTLISPPDAGGDTAPGPDAASQGQAGSGGEEGSDGSAGSFDDTSSGGDSAADPPSDSSSPPATGGDEVPVAPPGAITPPSAGDERSSDEAASNQGDGREARDGERQARAGEGDSGGREASRGRHERGADEPSASGERDTAKPHGERASAKPSAEHLEAPGAEAAGTRGERYTIEPGDSLWSIARDLLGEEASDAKVAAKVSKLWELNDTEVIRTGDPDLIRPGQELRLP